MQLHRRLTQTHALQRDLSRQNFLVLGGWTVLRFTWHDVTDKARR